MKMLVVHDRDDIADEIVRILKELDKRSEIKRVFDGVGAREALQDDLFDLVVMDLTLPHIRGKYEPQYQIAEELLTEIFDAALKNTPGDLIGITREPDALNRIDSKIGPHLMAIVEEDIAGNWKSQLIDRVTYVIRASRSRLLSLNRHYDYDVAIITALDKELRPYSRIFEFEDIGHFAGAKAFLFKDSKGAVRRGIAFSVGKAGQSSAASATQSIVTQFRPSICLMSGFCGGFAAKKVEIGSVLIAESVVDWDSGKWIGDGETSKFHPRPDPISIRDRPIHRVLRELVETNLAHAGEIIDEVRKLSDNRISKIDLKPGPVASGSALVTDLSIISRIQDLNENILGVDMEAFGFYYACSFAPVKRPEFVLIKAVSDFCGMDKDKKSQDACSYLSAKVVEEIICRRWEFEVSDVEI